LVAIVAVEVPGVVVVDVPGVVVVELTGVVGVTVESSPDLQFTSREAVNRKPTAALRKGFIN